MVATEAELGWFAGMLEGEGCITFFKQARSRGGFDIITGIQITNTDINIINALLEILKKCELSWHVRNKKVYSKNHSECWYVEVRQQKMIKKSLEIFIPFMFGNKKAKAKLVLDYLSKRERDSEMSGKFNTRYSKDDFSMIPRGHMLSSQVDEDMVHAL
jgi:hypothetical protein